MNTGSAVAFMLFLAGTGTVMARELVDYIDPMIGCSTQREGKSHGLGKTFPGPATPFGLVQLGPDTVTGGDNGPGYSTHHDTIEGFSFLHMSGIGWFGDLGNFLVTPSTGELQVARTRKGDSIWGLHIYAPASKFSHDEETTEAGYYAVNLARYGIKAELTAAPRAGILRFTYPESDTSRIQIDLARRIGMKSPVLKHSEQHVEVVDEHTIEGYMYCPNTDGGWGAGKGKVTYTLHFHAQFSKPIRQFGVWELDKIIPGARSHTGTNSGFYVEFPTTGNEQVLMKAGISFVSIEGARANLEHDIPDWDFDRVHLAARKLWSDALDGVSIEGGTEEQRTIFATSLYHSFIDPRSTSDIDGYYIGADREKHKSRNFTYRTIFSGWDVFRSQFPLLTILRPDIVNDQVNTLIELAEKSDRGDLPRWELLNSYSGCMVGDPAVVVISEAYRKGIRNYDLNKAYDACRKTVFDAPHNNGRKTYNQLGYEPNQISTTLEYCYADAALLPMAKGLGKKADFELLEKRAQNYRHIFDPMVGNMRAKDAEGNWLEWDSLIKGKGCVESNPYQQGWFVPHDVKGLIELMGGDEPFLKHLTEFFEKAKGNFLGWNEYYNHANEPVHHVAYLFPYAGRPWLTQKWVRIIMDQAYTTGVKGLCGNEDVGQMSAWYILSAMGFHPVDPASGIYIVGSPIFDKISIRLNHEYQKGTNLVILAENNGPQNPYVQALELNGDALDRAWLAHEELTGGGTLKFTMGPLPNKKWAAASRPPTLNR